MQEIKRFWDASARQQTSATRACMISVTFASLLVSGSLPMIGKLLGRTQPQTTQLYAHLFDDPLRAGLDRVGEMLRPKLKIVAVQPFAGQPNEPADGPCASYSRERPARPEIRPVS